MSECRNRCECMTVFLDGCVYMSMGMYVCLSVSVFDLEYLRGAKFLSGLSLSLKRSPTRTLDRIL